MERIKTVRLHRKATASREYDAITVSIGDLFLSCDLVNDRQIRLAKLLAASHGADFSVCDALEERAAKACQGAGRKM